jgi:hypothetical protein
MHEIDTETITVIIRYSGLGRSYHVVGAYMSTLRRTMMSGSKFVNIVGSRSVCPCVAEETTRSTYSVYIG